MSIGGVNNASNIHFGSGDQPNPLDVFQAAIGKISYPPYSTNPDYAADNTIERVVFPPGSYTAGADQTFDSLPNIINNGIANLQAMQAALPAEQAYINSIKGLPPQVLSTLNELHSVIPNAIDFLTAAQVNPNGSGLVVNKILDLVSQMGIYVVNPSNNEVPIPPDMSPITTVDAMNAGGALIATDLKSNPLVELQCSPTDPNNTVNGAAAISEMIPQVQDLTQLLLRVSPSVSHSVSGIYSDIVGLSGNIFNFYDEISANTAITWNEIGGNENSSSFALHISEIVTNITSLSNDFNIRSK